MNIFEHAMKMEEDGRSFYLEHAEKTGNPLLKKVLLELSDDELKHYNLFKAMRDHQAVEYKEAEKTTILDTVKNVFETMKTEKQDFTFPDDARNIWETAREIERKTEAFYRDQAKQLDDDAQKLILTRIADEEHRHWVTIENVIQFLDRPKQWLVDAEWPGLDD